MIKTQKKAEKAFKDTFKRIYSGNNKKMLDNLGKADAKGLHGGFPESRGAETKLGTPHYPSNSEKPAKPAFPLCEKQGAHKSRFAEREGMWLFQDYYFDEEQMLVIEQALSDAYENGMLTKHKRDIERIADLEKDVKFWSETAKKLGYGKTARRLV